MTQPTEQPQQSGAAYIVGPTAADVLRERYGDIPEPEQPLAVRDPNRALIIAGIHAYAQWLADNPDVPAPEKVAGTRHPRCKGDIYAVGEVRHMIDNYDAEKHTSSATGWSITPVVEIGPLRVTHTVFCDRPGSNGNEDWL